MARNISAAERADKGALGGRVYTADGTVYDWQAALASIVASLGGSEAAGIDELVAIAQAQLVQLEQIQATNAASATSNAASATSLALIDDTVGTIDSAHGNKVSVVGAKAEGTVPTEVADADAVALWADRLGRLITLYTDLSQSAASVSDIAPAQMQKAKWEDWAALTAPDDETPEANVQDFENLTVEYVVASIGTSVDLKIWGSIDGGTTWFLLTDTIQVLANGVEAVSFSGLAIERIKCEFDAEDGGTPTVTFKLMAGN